MIKELFEYTRSPVNIKNCEALEQLNPKYMSLWKQYADSYQKLSEYVTANECKRQYSKGGEAIHRGFYSPSSLDLVVGGYNRGRLLKNTDSPNKHNYEYIFDSKNNLICCNKYDNGIVSTEFIVYEQDRVLSFVYDTDDHLLSFMSECQFEDSKLSRYETVLCEGSISQKNCAEINVEILEYENDSMKSLVWQRYIPKLKLLTEERYRFSRDEKGYLSTYTVEQIGGFNSDSEKTSGAYKVLAKRK